MTGFPPIKEIREIREHFEDFFQSGKSWKNGIFSQNQRKNVKSGNFFLNIFKPFNLKNLRKMFLRLLNLRSSQEIALNEAYLHRLMLLRPHLKRINMFF